MDVMSKTKDANDVTTYKSYSFIVRKTFVKSAPRFGCADNKRMENQRTRFSEQHSRNLKFSLSFSNINKLWWLFKIKMILEKIPNRNLFRISSVHEKNLFVWIKVFAGFFLFCFGLFCFGVVASFKITKAEIKQR